MRPVVLGEGLIEVASVPEMYGVNISVSNAPCAIPKYKSDKPKPVLPGIPIEPKAPLFPLYW